MSRLMTRLTIDEQIADCRRQEERLRAKAIQVLDLRRRTKLERNAAGIRRKRIKLMKSLVRGGE